VGGYAVAWHGFPRATGDMDVWVAVDASNAARLVDAVREFGFDLPDLTPELFLRPDRIIRMGVPPLRLEILTGIDGVTFDECYASRQSVIIDGVEVDVIALDDLKRNKRAAGRHNDLNDLENLP
jgi:hypothetical protein